MYVTIYNTYANSTKLKYDSESYLTMPEKTFTNIRLTTATRDRLKSMGFKGENYDDVIVRLLDSIEAKGKPESIPATS